MPSVITYKVAAAEDRDNGRMIVTSIRQDWDTPPPRKLAVSKAFRLKDIVMQWRHELGLTKGSIALSS
ncbi:hypothetical protein O9993_00500 [Vibrio lentus]|nr:hypothetical protein [Vibrio lentus]